MMPINPLMANRAPAPMNPMQLLQQLRANPMQFLRQAGFNVPNNLNDPNQIIQHLMNSGQISQAQYTRAREMATRFNGNK